MVISLRGGSPLRGEVLTLKSPNGGESVLAGRTLPITWTNVLPQDPVRIEFSTNGGNSWRPIAEAATGLRYDWQAGPEVTAQGRIRVSRTMINEKTITILRGHVRPVYASVFTSLLNPISGKNNSRHTCPLHPFPCSNPPPQNNPNLTYQTPVARVL
jgi:hypothetical protein